MKFYRIMIVITSAPYGRKDKRLVQSVYREEASICSF